jgi:hypothetical protein
MEGAPRKGRRKAPDSLLRSEGRKDATTEKKCACGRL